MTQLTDYYRARAAEYDAVYAKPERQDDLDKVRGLLAATSSPSPQTYPQSAQTWNGRPFDTSGWPPSSSASRQGGWVSRGDYPQRAAGVSRAR